MLALAAASGPSRAAGMLASHYAPSADGRAGADRAAADERAAGAVERDGHRVVVIDHGDDLVAYARELYAGLRAADAAGADRIVAVLPPPAASVTPSATASPRPAPPAGPDDAHGSQSD